MHDDVAGIIHSAYLVTTLDVNVRFAMKTKTIRSAVPEVVPLFLLHLDELHRRHAAAHTRVAGTVHTTHCVLVVYGYTFAASSVHVSLVPVEA